jgi:glycosyltransferase involved in cell wall biosynthesis
LDAHLTVLGEGPERPRLEYTIKDLRLNAHVTLMGKLLPGRVRDILQQSHIFLHTALSEGLPNGLIEAMSCGLPVIATCAGGTSEALEDGVQGVLVPTRQPKAISDALVNLGRDPNLCFRMGQAGREKVLQTFDLKEQAQQFQSLYEWVLFGKPCIGEQQVS